MTVAASPRARILRSTLSELGPRLTRSPTNQTESRSAENFRAASSVPSSASHPCTSPIAYSAIRLLVEYSGHRQPEGRDRRVEMLAIIGDHLIAALHGADGGLDHGAGRVAKSLPGLQVRLLADDAIAAGFLHIAVRIRDDPVTCEQARRDLSFIANGNGAREYKTLVARIGLLLDIRSLDFHSDPGVHWFRCRAFHELTYAHRKHVAVRGMQDGVFGKIHQDAEAVTHAAANADHIDRLFLGTAHNLGFLVAGFDPRGHSRVSHSRRQLVQFY